MGDASVARSMSVEADDGFAPGQGENAPGAGI
jgi:hypothetical protein